MTQLKLIKSALNSRYIRSKVGNSVRTIDVKHEILRKKQGNKFVNLLGNAFKGFISAKIADFQKGWTNAGAIFGWLVQRVEQVKQFDWNASDKQLEALMESQNIRIATVWGTALGRSAGWLAAIACGYGISYLIPVVGGATLARAVTAGAAKEGLPEIGYALTNALEQTFGAWANNGMTSGFINYRKFMKWLSEKNLLDGLYGKDKAKWIREEWGKDGGPNMSFNSGMDDFIESIENKKLQAFLQAFLEEGWDSFIEGGMVVANQIDSAYAQQKAAQNSVEGKIRTVKLIPDKRKKDEIILLTGTQKQVKKDVVQNLANYRLIANRDVGQIVGMPADDYVSAKPLRRQLVIVFKEKKEPPWKMPNGKQAKQYEVTIPDVIMGLSWTKLKQVALAYRWGKFRATAHLDNGRQMAVYGASKSEAEKALRRLAELSTAKILTLNVTEEVQKKNIALRKDPKTVYPAFATLLVRKPTTGEGREFIDGTKMNEDRIRIDLWPTEQPTGLQPLK
ncbi:hypothetical protein [Pseudanabaena sp. 'Roaring Creek']|uniref:hypothetical protein n=1 Tax=Pseudanabaena sp. 'Roaring Creek' TaxID=1681830 RepID=UPI0006D7F858|nr:hypothetical protein [Pseudanabaena sp. 'Roaring Creek']